MAKRPAMTLDDAEAIGIAGLGYVAEDAVRLNRFLALTGLTPDQLRSEAGTPHMLAAVLDFLAGNESELVACAANHGYPPESFAMAGTLLRQAGERSA